MSPSSGVVHTGAENEARLVLSDVDGTLVNSDRELTPATIDAVGRLRDAGIAFALTSGRPPRGSGDVRRTAPCVHAHGGLQRR